MPCPPSDRPDVFPVAAPPRRAGVLQGRLDADADRPPFSLRPLAGRSAVALDDDEDSFGDAGAAPLFTGLFGEMPDTTTEPIRLPRR